MKKEDLHCLKLLLKVFRYSFIINYAIFGKLYVMKRWIKCFDKENLSISSLEELRVIDFESKLDILTVRLPQMCRRPGKRQKEDRIGGRILCQLLLCDI